MEIEKSSRNEISARRILSLQISFRFGRDNRWIANFPIETWKVPSDGRSDEDWTRDSRLLGHWGRIMIRRWMFSPSVHWSSVAWGKINFSQLSAGRSPKSVEKVREMGRRSRTHRFHRFGNARSYRWHEYFIGLFSGRFDPLCWLPAIGTIWLPGVN